MNPYKANRAKLFKDMKSGDMAIFFAGKAPVSSADSLYPFRSDKNFFYMTGLKKEGFILLMTKEEDKTTELLFIVEPNYDIEKWIGRALSKETCQTISAIDEVHYLDTFESTLNRLIYKDVFDRLYLDLAKVYHDRSPAYPNIFANKIQKDYPQLRIKNLHRHMTNYRVIKSPEEVAITQKAIDLTKTGLEAVMKALKPGDYEYVPAAAFDYAIMTNGADGNAFETIAASGDNATILHYIENDDVMNDGELILMDLGAQYGEYASDITRTYPVNGKFSTRQAEVYNLVLKAHDEVIKIMKPGIAFGELNKRSSEVLKEGLMAMGLVKEDSDLGKYYYHGVSHPMGLDTHDLGSRDLTLEAGMILTVEPGLYIAEEAIGIRIEDDVLITEDGHKVLSADIMRTVEDIEAFMAKQD